jgi:mono/diheme cytochrome c family protein
MTGRPAALLIVGFLILCCAIAAFATSNGAWMTKVPQHERERVNPYRGQPDAVAAGQRIFLDHCAKCHGKEAEGTKKRPSLKTTRVQQEATDGDLHWLLVNGNRSQGMPSWVKLGDPQIWQVICYVKSLH